MLVDQFVSASWRLQRTRRCEMAEIRKRLDSAGLRKQCDDMAAADLMKAKFLRYHSGRGNFMPGHT